MFFLIGFRKADQIARSMGLQPDDVHRLRAGLHYALEELSREGHTYAPREALLDKAADLLGIEDLSMLSVALKGQISAQKLKLDTLHDPNQPEAMESIYLPALPPRRNGGDNEARQHHR